MDALTELRNKNFSEKDHIERAICEFWEDTSGLEWLAERAAAELAALRERAEKAEAERDAVIENAFMAGWSNYSDAFDHQALSDEIEKNSLNKRLAIYKDSLKGDA